MPQKKNIDDRQIRPPKLGTAAASNYFKTYQLLERFGKWVMFMAVTIDRNAEIAHGALVKAYGDEERKRREEKFAKRTTMLSQLALHRQVFLEVLLIRHIDNFLNYLSELLSTIFVQRPETLRSSEQVELAEVLKFDSIPELVRAIAEKQVDKLHTVLFPI